MKMALLVFALFLLSVDVTMSQYCGQFPALFVGIIDQDIDSPSFLQADPDLIFFKEILKFRGDAIQHTFNDAIKFFNESFGLDFSSSHVYQNSTLGAFKISDDIDYLVTLNNWIQTGSTRSSCYRNNDGGIGVTFSGEQTLRGTYGGSYGKTVGAPNFLAYGFYSIDACEQSPIVLQYRSVTPLRQEPVDGLSLINVNLYNRVLGYGKAQGIFTLTPSLDDPGKYHFSGRNVFSFENKGNN